MTSAASPGSEPRWFGHPRGLTVLFFTEAWEKFSYYGMRALLVLYMTKDLAFSQPKSSLVYSFYTGAAYATPIIGGVIADRWLGRRRAVLIGSLIMALGHFMMAFKSAFYPALFTIALGNGFFLPSLPSQVRGLYRPGDPRLDSAYSLYYLGINLGAVLAGVVCGALQATWGAHYGFAAAGVGMLLGFLIYWAGGRYLPETINERRAKGQAPARQAIDPRAFPKLALLIAVTLVVVIFRGTYEQQGNTIVLWSDQDVSRGVFGLQIPAAVFQSVNPAVVILFTPLLVWWWLRQAKKGKQASPVRKMAVGAAIVALSYLMLAGVAWQSDLVGAKANVLWLIGFLAFMTVGELYILPIGLALFGRLAPRGLEALTIAVWFSAISLGSLFAGQLGVLWSRFSHAEFFGLMAGVSLLASALLLIFDGPAKRLDAAKVDADLSALHLEG